MSDKHEELVGLAHEIWAMAQLMPGESITDGRIVDRLESELEAVRGGGLCTECGYDPCIHREVFEGTVITHCLHYRHVSKQEARQ